MPQVVKQRLEYGLIATLLLALIAGVFQYGQLTTKAEAAVVETKELDDRVKYLETEQSRASSMIEQIDKNVDRILDLLDTRSASR